MEDEKGDKLIILTQFSHSELYINNDLQKIRRRRMVENNNTRGLVQIITFTTNPKLTDMFVNVKTRVNTIFIIITIIFIIINLQFFSD